MNHFRALVADDEPLARAMVADLLRRDPEIQSVTECASVNALRDALAAQAADILFLDIEMPESSGLDVAGQLGADGPAVVFVTAYAQYAPHAFDVNATDYILKPFSDARFTEAVGRAKRRVRDRRLGALAGQFAALSEHGQDRPAADPLVPPPRPGPLVVKDGDRTIVLQPADILWVEAEDYYVLIHTTRGRHMVRVSMAALEDRLGTRQFARVHRGALVNIDAIREVRNGGSLLLLSNNSEVPVSRSRRTHVDAILRAR